MSTKFTPGPWIADGHRIHTAHGYVVAVLPNENRDADSETTAADADLIAAAPEMLAALQSIAEYWNRDHNETAMADACWHAIETALVAIAKATGEPQ